VCLLLPESAWDFPWLTYHEDGDYSPSSWKVNPSMEGRSRIDAERPDNVHERSSGSILGSFS
jgi:hypothetical protein